MQGRMDRIKILVADDEKEITELVGLYLQNEGYLVFTANNGKEALKLLDEQDLQLVILDIMMPGMDGLETCRQIRRDRNIPIIMLSAKSEDMDKIMGLSTGADDYMTKPFNPLELIARVKSQLRRYLFLNPESSGPRDSGIVEAGSLSVDPASRSVKLYGEEIGFTPTEFDILYLLMRNRGHVYRAEEIYEKVRKEQCFESKSTIMVHIRNIREKIEEDPRNPIFIKTVWGVGYIIEK